MRILTKLEPFMAARVTHAPGRHNATRDATTWHEYEAALQANLFDVCVVDPAAPFGGSPLEQAVVALRASSGLPLVIYTKTSSLTSCLPIAQELRVRLVLFGLDDGVEALHRVIDQAARGGLLQPILARVEVATDGHEALGNVIRLLFTEPERVRSVADLVRHSGMSRRRLFRECERTSLSEPLTLVRAAQAAFAYHVAVLQHATFKEVARRWETIPVGDRGRLFVRWWTARRDSWPTWRNIASWS